jgi:hypothetical protein
MAGNQTLDLGPMRAATEQERREALKILENSYDMYQTSREETINIRKTKTDKDGNRIYSDKSLEDTLELMDTMLDDIVRQYVEIGGNPEDLKKRKKKKRDDKRIKESIERISNEDGMTEFKKSMVEEAKKREKNKYTNIEEESATTIPVQETDYKAKDREYKRRLLEGKEANTPQNVVQNNSRYTQELIRETTVQDSVPAERFQKTSFDEVSLPSRGECYRNKKGTIRVSHLVAYDENLILSPGLYKNGTFLDHILKNKILDDINPDDLIQGDRDAIIIWLRAGGYGPLYPIKMLDEESGKEFETNVDLSKLDFKKFDLKGDENGYFDFTLPNSGDVVKFRFLTAGDAKRLEKMRREENESQNATDMRDKIRDIVDFIDNSDKISSKESEDMIADLHDIEDVIYSRYKNSEDALYTHDLTNRLVMSTVSVNGNTDRSYIANYILNMNLKDAADYRKYIIDNEPGIDYNIKVKRPDSLGGGYIDTFLQLDQFIFIY